MGSPLGSHTNEKSFQRWLDHELEVMVNVHKVRIQYEKQSQVQATLAEEITKFKQKAIYGELSPPRGKNGHSQVSNMPPNTRLAMLASLDDLVSMSSNALVAMASQISEAEEREQAFTSRGQWNQLRSMGDDKNLLQYMFNVVARRCKMPTEEQKNRDEVMEERQFQLEESSNIGLRAVEESLDQRPILPP
ncbi:hypothetical protein IEQ34_010282 [Dendrobium chrysotoxum]|uniref:Uncharacterized protein n=1 Tax=Dendrobium chrysotoxum TaxID=161865 RepID=A0AAV7H4B9_DENCH|nr:hypothetical protein IEQ34_010282 [Dendrobium chrysotoxum]